MENQMLQLILDKLISVESDVRDLKQGQAKLEQGQAETNARLDNLETKFDNLTHLVHGIHIHQEMDFKLLMDVSQKVHSLADVKMLQ